MNYLDRKLYLYFINNEDQLTYNEIEQLFIDQERSINEAKQKIKKSIKKMRKELKKYNVCSLSAKNLPEIQSIYKEYNLSDEEKKTLHNIITKLSEIHNIDLTEQEEPKELTEEEIFYSFCSYYINDIESIDTYNDLLSLSKQYNFNFNEMQASAIDFIEKLKISLEKYKLTISYESFNTLLTKYKKEKKNYTDNKKAEILKLLASLSKIYNINLREELTTPNNIINAVNKKESINPLHNNDFIKKLLQSRYDNGTFEIQSFYSKEDIKPNDLENYDNTKEHANLTYKLIAMFYDKITNYAEQDLNEFFLSLISEDDYSRMSELTSKDIFTFIMAMNNHIDKESICNKLSISNSLYNFIFMALDTTNIYNESIGLTNNNIFKTEDYQPSYIIYLNTPNAKCTGEFLSEYITKCIDHNIDYYLKGLNINGNNKDRTIIYSKLEDYNTKINIIDTILNEHSEWSNKFGTPIPFIKPSVESLYSISDYITDEITFIDYFNDLCEVSYYRVLAKLLLNKLDNDNELTIINSIINLNNIVPKELPSKTIYNAYTFDEIKDTINRYIPDIINTIRLYIEEETNIEDFIKEFTKSLQYLHNIVNKKDKKDINNIIFSGEKNEKEV
ncbi:MAG: hypothetical protein ACI4OP_06695 [Candidatus Coprovivens sp.]